MKRLSIIIVTYNSEKDIYDCLDSIRQHSDINSEELEIIVVDNNSRQADAMFAEIRNRYGNGIMLLKNTHNGGYGQGNNIGIRQATAPVILIMNPDVRLMEPIFSKALSAFGENRQLAILGMKQMLSETTPATNSFSCTYMMNGYLATLLTAIGNRTALYLPRLMHFSGSCFFINKQMFEAIGLFDESIFMYGEEDDINFRLRQRFGICQKYAPRLHYIHLCGERKPSLDYEEKLLNVAIANNEKKGYPRRKTILNRLRSTNIQYWREYLRVKMGKQDLSLYNMLKAWRQHLSQLLNEHNSL